MPQISEPGSEAIVNSGIDDLPSGKLHPCYTEPSMCIHSASRVLGTPLSSISEPFRSVIWWKVRALHLVSTRISHWKIAPRKSLLVKAISCIFTSHEVFLLHCSCYEWRIPCEEKRKCSGQGSVAKGWTARAVMLSLTPNWFAQANVHDPRSLRELMWTPRRVWHALNQLDSAIYPTLKILKDFMWSTIPGEDCLKKEFAQRLRKSSSTQLQGLSNMRAGIEGLHATCRQLDYWRPAWKRRSV